MSRYEHLYVTYDVKFYLFVFIDDQHPSSGSISVFIITKYNIDTVFPLYHIAIYLHVTIYVTISIYRGSTI